MKRRFRVRIERDSSHWYVLRPHPIRIGKFKILPDIVVATFTTECGICGGHTREEVAQWIENHLDFELEK